MLQMRLLWRKTNITLHWRTLKTGGVVNEKYPDGINYQKQLLERWGYKIVQKGKKYVIQDYEKMLI